MKVALDPAMLAGRPIATVFQSAQDAGYAYLELGNREDVIPAYEPVAAAASELDSIRQQSQASGVELRSVAVIQSWSSPDEDVRKRAVDWWRDGIEAAARLGCRHLNTELTGDPLRPEACRDAFLRSVETLLPLLAREGMDVAVEPHPGDFAETTASAIELIRTIGSPRLRYLHCLPHTYYLGGTVADQVDHARGWFEHVHVADTYRPGRTIVNPTAPTNRVHQHFDIGTGELDWAAIAAALRSVNFDGILTIQVFGWEDRADESFRANRAAAARLFEPAAGPVTG